MLYLLRGGSSACAGSAAAAAAATATAGSAARRLSLVRQLRQLGARQLIGKRLKNRCGCGE